MKLAAKVAGRDSQPAVRGRPITDAIRAQIVEELPEINEIKDAELRAKVIEAWALSLTGSSFASLRDMQACGVPCDLEAKSGDQTDHFRGVARLAMQMGDDFIRNFPDIDIDRDLLIAGALCHDIGKCWEFDPENRTRWTNSRHTGRPSLRHPAYGAHICLTVGLPEGVCHMAAAHSREGEMVQRSIENTIVAAVDHAYWMVLAAGDYLVEDTLPAHLRR